MQIDADAQRQPYRPSCLFSLFLIGVALLVGVPTIAGYHHANNMRGEVPVAPLDSATGSVTSSSR